MLIEKETYLNNSFNLRNILQKDKNQFQSVIQNKKLKKYKN